MFLLFRVGLEVESSELVRVGDSALSVAALGVLIPLPSVLAAKGLIDHAASKVILAAAVIYDVLGLIVLSVVSSLARNSVTMVELL
jgi:Kef-type K+ transport system membrane component KefB